MMTLHDYYSQIKNQVMIEDETSTGGKSYDNETYGDFIDENEIDLWITILEFNKILEECGLLPFRLY